MLSISGRYSAEMKSTIHILLSCHHSISIDDNACRFVLLGYIIIPGLIENISWIQHLAVGIRALECIYIKLNVKLSVITEGTGAELGRSLVNCAGYSKLLFSIMWRGKGLFPKINWRVWSRPSSFKGATEFTIFEVLRIMYSYLRGKILMDSLPSFTFLISSIDRAANQRKHLALL